MVLFIGGLTVMDFCLQGTVNLNMEGLFKLVFAGTMGATSGHNLVTVIVGPLVFGRLVCGWGCWRSMLLELLPISRSTGGRRGGWNLLAFLGLGVTAGVGVLSVFVLGLTMGFDMARETPFILHG